MSLLPINLEQTFHSVVDLTDDETHIPEAEECPICYSTVTKSEQFIINGCGHMICKDCEPNTRAHNYIIDHENLLPVLKCPMCRQPEIPSTQQYKDRIKLLNNRIRILNTQLSQAAALVAQRELPLEVEINHTRMNALEQQVHILRRQLNTNGLIPHSDINPFVEIVNNSSQFIHHFNEQQTRPQTVSPESTPRTNQGTRNIQPNQRPTRTQQQGNHLEYCRGICNSNRRTRHLCLRGCGVNCCRRCRECSSCRPRNNS
jgi:hypothetical protein